MPSATANGLELAYEVMGDGAPLLMIMGLGAQLVHWPDGLCETLADRGFRVIRFDNRDVGLSTKLESAETPDVKRMLARRLVGLSVRAPYTLIDMADDAVGLLDALGVARAHVVGMSMGGMIAQTLAIRHPERLASLTSIASHDGSRRFSLIHPKVARLMLQPPPRSRDEAMARAEAWFSVVGSKAFELDWPSIRERAARAYDRCFYPRGFARQLAAVLAGPPRGTALRFVRVPAAVIHGSVDPLISPAGGKATARAIPGTKLELVEGMGHDLPEGAWPIIVDVVAGVAARA